MSIGYHKKGFLIKVTVTSGSDYTSNLVGEWEDVVPSNVYYTSGIIKFYYDFPLYVIPDIPYPVEGDTTTYYYHYFINGNYFKSGTMRGYRNTVTKKWQIDYNDPIKGQGSSTPDEKIHLIVVEKSDGYYLVFPSFYLTESGTGYKYYEYDGKHGLKLNYDIIDKYGFPYGDGESTSQGGQGEMTDTSDPIEIDSKPLLTTGDFLRVYKLTATDLSALQAKLISNGFLDGLIAKLRTDAMDYIVGLNAIPINATNVAASTIKIANLDTEISASYLSWYIEDIDFGEIALTEYFQTFMDYSPYTKLSVYIPYCGIVSLNIDNFMNDKISMKCRVDMLTGQFVVFVSNSVGVITTVSGNCAYQLPIRANDYNRLVTSGLGLLGGIVGTAGALATGNIPLAIGAGLGTVGGLFATSQSMTKPDVTSKGSLGGNYGLLGNRTPYLIIQRPAISVPSDYGKTIGYMSRITAKLGDLTGYTVVEEIHLEHISATDDEKKLIENALKSGVIL